MAQRWPERLWIVRHGQSLGNVARDLAEAGRHPRIDIAHRDMDVPLSPLGREQSCALGRWFAALPEDERPQVVLTSPYVRARETADIMRDCGGLSPEARRPVPDERLREKEFGVLDRLTRSGIEAQFPEQAEFRRLRLAQRRQRHVHVAGRHVELVTARSERGVVGDVARALRVPDDAQRARKHTGALPVTAVDCP